MAKSGASRRKDGGKKDSLGIDWRRERPVRYEPPPNLPKVDVHGILFAVVAVVFVVYPLIQWALGR